ncbi:MAG: hypothetical protein JWN04_3864, partial [Myxococcaceae bacterium]|nr:hypothetical protein [Myxococcaceae bacterium]
RAPGRFGGFDSLAGVDGQLQIVGALPLELVLFVQLSLRKFLLRDSRTAPSSPCRHPMPPLTAAASPSCVDRAIDSSVPLTWRFRFLLCAATELRSRPLYAYRTAPALIRLAGSRRDGDARITV